MIRCLIKPIGITMNNKGFSLSELMMAVACTVFLMAGIASFYTISSQSYTTGMSGQILQNGANIVLSKIIDGDTESGVVYRLSTAQTYMVPNGAANHLYTCGGAPQSTSCDVSQTASELYYCQDAPTYCNSSDATARWYYLNHAGSAVMYHYPGEATDQAIYTAPTGSMLTLRFSPATSTPLNAIEIDVAVTQNISGGTTIRLAANGSASTYVLLRNHL